MEGACPVPVMARKSSLSTTPAVKLRNLSTRADTFDTLCYKAPETSRCSERVCHGSLVSHTHGRSRTSGTARPPKEVLSQAREFLDEYYSSIKRSHSPAHMRRWEQVQSEVQLKGTYELTETELVYGSKLAWRNAERCIGRIQWTKLQVFDARYVTTAGGMFEAVCNHIKYGTNKGNIRSAITIFPQRTDAKHDYRIWNAQLISYAAYRLPDNAILGDPANLEFTEVCQKLGWRGQGGRWDILPLVVSAAGQDPEYFELPEELILQVPVEHPRYDWFSELDLRWYALPAVSNMLFDVGGVEFPAAPFNGWYMLTEIACRDLADSSRLNVLEQVAFGMGLDTNCPASLWKDRALVELNVAVLHSFQTRNVTIVDHHTASESFMKHLENESRLRGGCPADWVWIVPPLSSSLTPVFHQEMLLYTMKPSYEYQEPAWKTHQWKKGRGAGGKNRADRRKSTRKFRFREIARAVKFTSKLFGKAMSRRIKATVLYATETGKSEGFAKTLCTLFNHAFNAQVVCLADYDVISLEHETIVLVVTSTFGNGDPPENGEEFAKNLFSLKMNGTGASVGQTVRHSKSFIKKNSQTEMRSSQSRESSLDHVSLSELGPLSNVRFAVFALGSSAYPNFCAFGAYVDKLLGELGGERLWELCCGDELCGQQQAFLGWARDVFRAACDVLCVGDDSAGDLTAALMNADDRWERSKVRVVAVEDIQEDILLNGLSKVHNRTIIPCRVIDSKPLYRVRDGGQTVQVTLDTGNVAEMTFRPGDHIGFCPENRGDQVEGILLRLSDCQDPDQVVQVQTLQEHQSINGTVNTWVINDRVPPCSVRTALSRFFDITSPPSHQLLRIFSSVALDAEEKARLSLLAADTQEYENWKHTHYPTLLEVLKEFQSVKLETSLLMTQLPLMQPRFYSISSSPKVSANLIQLTIAVVQFRTQGSSGPLHFGVCSNYLANVSPEDIAYCFIRAAPNFRLSDDSALPVIMVGPGTGIAPFRSFWQERKVLMNCSSSDSSGSRKVFGPMTLYFGCRLATMHLYREETESMMSDGVLQGVFTAYSREPHSNKRYVQELLMERKRVVYEEVHSQRGHMYVCGDVSMAEDVCRTLRNILSDVGAMSVEQADAYVLAMRDENRYHEDIFGVTFRTAEVRAAARSRIAS